MRQPHPAFYFSGIPIDDLAYAGERKKQKYHIEEQNRDARIISMSEIEGFEKVKNCRLLVPPTIKHEVGADALALIVKAGMIESNETAIATDYGTNAEMALKANGLFIPDRQLQVLLLKGRKLNTDLLLLLKLSVTSSLKGKTFAATFSINI